jgi:hypothetical protein
MRHREITSHQLDTLVKNFGTFLVTTFLFLKGFSCRLGRWENNHLYTCVAKIKKIAKTVGEL